MMAFDWGTALVSIGGTGVVSTAVAAFVNRRKLGADVEKVAADAADTVTKAALVLVEPLGKRIHELQAEVDSLRDKVRETTDNLEACHAREREKDRLISQLTQPGGTT